jgi:hypothetical protein
MPPTRVVNIHNTPWLLGLSWRSFEQAPTRSEIKADAAQLAAIWYVTRIGKSAIQCGFGNPPLPSPTRARGLYSLAALLADTAPQPWRGVFQVEEGVWWYIAVRDGHAILPDGDQVGGQDMLLAVREKHAAYDDWHEIEGNILNLSDRIAAQKSQRTPVRSLNGPGVTASQMFVLTVLLAGLVSGYMWWQHRIQATLKARLAAMAALKSGMAVQQAQAHPSLLLTTPDAETWLRACKTIIEATPLSVNGWTLSGVACESNAVNWVWKRGLGATVASRPDGTLSDNDTVAGTAKLPLLPNGHGETGDLAHAKTRLIAGLQKTGIDLQMVSPSSAPVLPGQAPALAAAVTPASLPFSFDTPIPVFDLNLDIPGLRLNKISMIATGWHVEGVLYGQ